MSDGIKKIAMCWKCSCCITVPLDMDNGARTMAGCNKMADHDWKAAVARNPSGGIPSWEDCPLSKEIPEEKQQNCKGGYRG